MKGPLPLARTEGVLSQEFSGELVVYDLERDKAHCLNRAAALVWKNCNGQRTLEELTALLRDTLGLPPDERITRLALESLARAHLLDGGWSPSPPGAARLSRRQLVKRLGMALSAVPLVASLAAPAAAAASTCLASGHPCTGHKQCCSGVCSGGFCA